MLTLKCPKCEGEPIGVEVRGVYDGVLYWECLACRHSWHRFPADDWRHAKAAPYVTRTT